MALQHVLANCSVSLHRTAKYKLHACALHDTKMPYSNLLAITTILKTFADAAIEELGLENVSGIIKVVIFAGDVRDLE